MTGAAGEAGSASEPGAGEPLALAQPDWLRQELIVSGPAETVTRFREAARGSGTIPWPLDLDHEEARLLAPIAGMGPAARSLARELREVIAARHDRMIEGWRTARGCPFDLHRLIPVPDAILRLGEDAPAARQWLWEHWGTVQALRRVRVLAAREDRRLRRSARIGYGFYSADWTPWRAIARLRHNWPALILSVRPCYDDTGGTTDA